MPQRAKLALAVTATAGDGTGEAHTHLMLGVRQDVLREHPDARNHYQLALAHFEDNADWAGRAHAHLRLAQSFLLQAEGAEAELSADEARAGLRHAHQAVELFRHAGQPLWEGAALDSLGDQMMVMHMVQHMLLLDIAPILLILGLTKVLLRPVTKRFQAVERRAIEIDAAALPFGRLVGVKAEAFERREYVLGRARHRARAVDVFHAHEPCAAVRARIKPTREC